LLSNQVKSLKEYHGRIYAGTADGLNILTPPPPGDEEKWKIESLGASYGITKNARTYNSDLLSANGQYWWGDNGITIISNIGELSKSSNIPLTYLEQ
jgi:hypothetical protein